MNGTGNVRESFAEGTAGGGTMTVLSIAFSYAPVSSEAVGGAEQILNALDEALCAAGHTSLVLACEGSRVAGELLSFPLPEGQGLEEFDRARCRSRVQAIIDRVTSLRHVDLVHMHGLDFDSYAIPAGIPVLVTLHLPIDWYEPDCWSRFGSRAQFCCVSQTQRRGCRHSGRGVCVIENGVALPPLPTHVRKRDFALVMGRICPEKNAAAALEAGTLARTRVLLAGQAFPYREHRRYLQERIAPLLERARGDLNHAFLGPVASAQRQELLAEAKCLLHPTLAPETSSLVAMEAMAAGTPVIAYRSGALPEIVEEGVTGFLVDSMEEMAAAIVRVHTLSPGACRQAAERRFSRERMVDGYFELYKSMQLSDERRYA